MTTPELLKQKIKSLKQIWDNQTKRYIDIFLIKN